MGQTLLNYHPVSDENEMPPSNDTIPQTCATIANKSKGATIAAFAFQQWKYTNNADVVYGSMGEDASAAYEQWEQTEDTVHSVFSYLHLSEVQSAQGVCKRWKDQCAKFFDTYYPPKNVFQYKDEFDYAMMCYQRRNWKCDIYRKKVDQLARTFGFPMHKLDVSHIQYVPNCEHNDVLLPRHGGEIDTWHPGTCVLMDKIKETRPLFAQCRTREERSRIVQMVVDFVHHERKGRFLNYDNYDDNENNLGHLHIISQQRAVLSDKAVRIGVRQALGR